MPLVSFDRDESFCRGSPWKLKSGRPYSRIRTTDGALLLWVIYLGFFFIDPVMSHASLRIWSLDIAGALIFLLLYFGDCLPWNVPDLVTSCGMVLLGILFLPFNPGACTFFIFGAAMLPFCVPSKKVAVIGLATIGPSVAPKVCPAQQWAGRTVLLGRFFP